MFNVVYNIFEYSVFKLNIFFLLYENFNERIINNPFHMKESGIISHLSKKK